jgi:hypothetical protein
VNELLEQLADADYATRERAMVDYRDLLQRRDAPQAGDAGRLRQIMAVLGITAADVQADASAIGQVTSLARQVLTPAQLKAAADELGKARGAFEAELRQLVKDMADSFDAQALHFIVEWLAVRAPAAPKGTPPFCKRQADIVARLVAAESRHMTAKGLHDQNAKLADTLRAKHPRAFAD